MWSVPRSYNQDSWSNEISWVMYGNRWRQFCTGGYEDRTWTRETEESSLLEAVAEEGLVKTQQAVNGLACGVICEVRR
jgi:hypothetical protein